VFDGDGGSVGGCCFIPRGSSPLVAYNAHDRQFGVLFTTAPEGAYSAYYVAGARVLENGDHSVDGIVAPGTTYGASFASDSHEGTYLAAWPGSNGGDGEASFLAANLTPIAPAHFAAGYVVTYNPAADEYLLVRSSCIQPGGLLAVCGRRVGNPPAAADRTGPALRLSVRRLQRIVRQRGLVLRARCDEACVVRASARVGVTALKLHPDKKSLTPGAAKKLKLKATKEILRTLRHVLRHRNRLKVRLKVTATDFAGNRTIAKRKLRARR
jgi:hypothetical protein